MNTYPLLRKTKGRSKIIKMILEYTSFSNDANNLKFFCLWGSRRLSVGKNVITFFMFSYLSSNYVKTG